MSNVYDPCGYYVLIEMEKAMEKTTESGIVLPDNEVDRENRANDRGTLVALGNLAYTGLQGIDDDLPVEERAALWGVKIGDKVEIQKKYEGKLIEGEEVMYRKVADQMIVGVIK